MPHRLTAWSIALVLTGVVLWPRALVGAGEPVTVIATSSSRPADCAQTPSLWRRASGRGVVSFCDLLLAASARLEEAPLAALELAQRAARLEPARPEPWVLVGRAWVLQGEFAVAVQQFAEAEKRDGRALTSPLDLLAVARAEARTGAYASALERYRSLIPRLRFLAEHRQRQRALLEAALVAQLVSPRLSAEARAYAAEVRRQDAFLYGDLSRAVLALILDREGRRDEARALAREVDGPWKLIWVSGKEPNPRGRSGELSPVWPPAEREALRAVLLEPMDAALAQEAWSDYLEALGREAPQHVIDHALRRGGALREREPGEDDRGN